MKTVGIVGGIAPESTVQYYRLMVAGYRDRKRDGSYPPILINSIDMQRMLATIGADDLSGVTTYLFNEVERLARAGADFALFASNTPHIVFDQVQQRASIPMLSIVEAACAAAQCLGLKRVGLFGTRFTMQGRFYFDVFSRKGIDIVAPEPEDQEFIHHKYMSELVSGIYLPETRAEMLAIAGRLQEREKIDGLVLGGTELPLLLHDVEDISIPLLDTTQIHVDAALERMFG